MAEQTYGPFRKQARELLAAIRERNGDAIRRFRTALPDQLATDETISDRAELRWCERVIAREHGFAEIEALSQRIGEAEDVASSETLKRVAYAVETADVDTVREILGQYPYLAKARLYDCDNEYGDTLLHRADADWSRGDGTTDGRIEIAQLLLDHGVDVNVEGGRENTVGETPVGAAGWANNPRMVKFLLEKGADANIVTNWGFNALGTIGDHSFGKGEMMEAIIESGAKVEPRHLVQAGLADRLNKILDVEPERVNERNELDHFDGRRGALLHTAVGENNIDMVELLLKRSADPNVPDNYGRTPLHYAIDRDSKELINTLKGAGAEIDAAAAIGLNDKETLVSLLDGTPNLIHSTRPDGGTLLHVAVEFNKPDMVRVLLELGVDLEAENDEGLRAIHVCAAEHAAIAEMLLDAGAEGTLDAYVITGNIEMVKELVEQNPRLVNQTLEKRKTPLVLSIVSNQFEMMKYLLSVGADPNGGKFLDSPWIVMTRVPEDRSVAFIDALVAAGADVNRVEWQPAVGHFIHRGRLDDARAVLRHGGDINLKNPYGLTPLQQHVERHGIVKDNLDFLFENGADVNALSDLGETALDLAIKMNNESVADLLRRQGGKRAIELG
jgi:ankyrin repeat protein